MRALRLGLVFPFYVAAALGAKIGTPQLAPAPVFPPGDAAETMHGVKVADPYRALENASDPKVQAWADAENARTRGWLDALPGRKAVGNRLAHWIHAESPSDRFLQPRADRIFDIYTDPAKQQPALAVLDAAASPASRRMLLDPNVLDPHGLTAIDWFVASPDGTKVAASLSKNGSEDGTLHVLDARTGHEIETPIPRVQYPTAGGSLAWSEDGRGFWYTRYPGDEAPEADRHFDQQVFFHALGSDAARDRLALGKRDGVPRTGEIFLKNDFGGKAALASVQLGDGGQWQHWVLLPGGGARRIGEYADRVVGGAVIAKDGTIFAVCRGDAPTGKVLRLGPPYRGGFAHATMIIPPQNGAAIIDGGEFGVPLAIAGDRLFVNRVAGGPSAVTVYDSSGRGGTALKLPPVSAVSEIDGLPVGGALLDVSTYLAPRYFLRWDAQTRALTRTALAETSPVSFADAEVRRIFATSKDGTRVPVSVIVRRDTKLDGTHPMLLTGYGGFGISSSPAFLGATTRLWLNAGGSYAEANIRGGGEYGSAWHENGMLTKKQNVFDDFAASADALVGQKYTSHEKLALIGGSNGGLLMGAMVTQHPDLARALVSFVGLYDMVRMEQDPNGAFNTSEFGTVKDSAQFAAIYAYSPYHHVKAGEPYPAVLLLEGANDGRVNPMQSRKFAAALQAATLGDRPILLRVSKSSGHGIGSSLDERIGEQTDMLMFLFDQLGMNPEQAARAGM